jgi:hypothetical protein
MYISPELNKGNKIYRQDRHVIRWLIRVYFEHLKC